MSSTTVWLYSRAVCEHTVNSVSWALSSKALDSTIWSRAAFSFSCTASCCLYLWRPAPLFQALLHRIPAHADVLLHVAFPHGLIKWLLSLSNKLSFSFWHWAVINFSVLSNYITSYLILLSIIQFTSCLCIFNIRQWFDTNAYFEHLARRIPTENPFFLFHQSFVLHPDCILLPRSFQLKTINLQSSCFYMILLVSDTSICCTIALINSKMCANSSYHSSAFCLLSSTLLSVFISYNSVIIPKK